MIIGWDIGGVNTKAALVGEQRLLAVRSRAFELQREPAALVPTLRALASDLTAQVTRAAGAGNEAEAAAVTQHAVTMTAELSQMFRRKRDGVTFVLDAVAAAFPDAAIHVYRVDGTFVDIPSAKAAPLRVAAANWAATAHLVAGCHPDALLIDVGTTTTDIIPIVGGRVAATGTTDPDRLASGELVYTGAVRTAAEALSPTVPYRGSRAGVSAEAFALAGDVHVWRGALAPSDYGAATPDGRPPSREFAGERLARVICADLDMLDDGDVSAIADALADGQVRSIAAAVSLVAARHPGLRRAVVTGLGAFIGSAAATAAGLEVVPLAAELGDAGARSAPAAAVALLRSAAAPHGRGERGVLPSAHASNLPRHPVDLVVKLGGGTLADAADFEQALAQAADAVRGRRAVIVPGGGPFADTVREVDRRLSLTATAAHWMAVLAMDQYAQLVASRLADADVVQDAAGVERALRDGRIPVLAPGPWLRLADPLPHSWDVTSDSIAAWIAGQLGATSLLLIKPSRATGDLVDGYFATAVPAGVTVDIRTARR